MSVTIERCGQRVYLNGNTYPIKDKIKSLGGHWDGDRKAWWVGSTKAGAVEQLVNGVASSQSNDSRQVGSDSKVVAKAKYKGRTYYVLWMGRCKNGQEKAHLTVLDAKIDFWADLSQCEIVKHYHPREYRGRTEYTTLGSIARFLEKMKSDRENGVEMCASCGTSGDLVCDLEDGLMKHRRCCDIEP
jgi:hypothetical protein